MGGREDRGSKIEHEAGDRADDLRGVIPILAMPFLPTGEIDEESLRREVEWVSGCGANGIGLARASELPRLDESERTIVTRIVVDQVKGRLPVVVHVGAESAHVARLFSERAEAEGADALMIPPPTFEVLGGRGQSEYFERVVTATRLPVILQDIPSARLDLSVVSSLIEKHPGRISLKLETPPTPFAVEGAVRSVGGRAPIFGGAGGGAFYSELLRGAAGTMPGCAAPELFVNVWRLFEGGEVEAARQAFNRLVPFLTLTGVPGLILAFYREALVRRGVFTTASARSPGAELTDVERAELVAVLEDLGIDRPAC